ncbi:MAG: histidine phosphatase family protein [Pseudomonadota bacterium]
MPLYPRLLALLLAIFTLSIEPLPARAEADILKRLAEPRTHAIMRHALAPGRTDPENFDLRDCATQRNLDDTGRAQAGVAGRMVRAAGVRVDHLWSSAYCRCLETAELMGLGPVEKRSMLNSFIVQRWRGTAQTEETQAALADLPPGETAFLVTHNVNAEALTGDRPISGEIQVVRVGQDGTVDLLGSVEVPFSD